MAWRQADALALPFDEAAFDAVVCQFGVMFFPDRVAGFREARRVLKPGGRLVFSVWGSLADNPVFQALIDGLARRYPQHPSWFLERTPCGYRDPAVIRADLAAAAHLSVVDYFGDVPWSDFPTAKTWYMKLKSRPSFRPLLSDRWPGMVPAGHYDDLDF